MQPEITEQERAKIAAVNLVEAKLAAMEKAEVRKRLEGQGNRKQRRADMSAKKRKFKRIPEIDDKRVTRCIFLNTPGYRIQINGGFEFITGENCVSRTLDRIHEVDSK